MSIWVILREDRHIDNEVWVFDCYETAIKVYEEICLYWKSYYEDIDFEEVELEDLNKRYCQAIDEGPFITLFETDFTRD